MQVSSDELGRLALEFSAMYDRLEAAKTSLLAEQDERARMESSLRNTARLASLGQLAAGLAHEIGTPLGVIAGRAESLQRRLAGNGQAEQSLGVVLDQIDRITRIVRSMLDFAKVRELHLAETDLGAVLDSTLEFVSHRLEDLGIEVETWVAPGARPVRGDAENLQEVVLNLVLNAADAMPSGGRLSVMIRPQRRAHPEHGAELELVEMVFRDDGSGIAEEHIDRVFDPFFTTKEVGKGTGLGLSVSYGIVREHGGWMEAESAPNQGTTMRVLLPVAGPPPDGGLV
jgi:signal transduction histidine kinase